MNDEKKERWKGGRGPGVRKWEMMEGGVKVKAQLTHVKVRRQDRNERGDLGRYLLTIDY